MVHFVWEELCVTLCPATVGILESARLVAPLGFRLSRLLRIVCAALWMGASRGRVASRL
jgi:hypothetical protein